jgi:rhomboid protease GluP
LPEKDFKNMDMIYIDNLKSVPTNKVLTSAFKKIKTNLSTDEIDIEQLINKTEDVNRKTEKKNKVYEDIFKPKRMIVTPIIIMACVLYYIYILFKTNGNLSAVNLLYYGANYRPAVQAGEWYRLFSSMFIHAGVLHLMLNMYALYIIGGQMESYLGKIRYIIVYILSGLVGNLFSLIFTNSVTVGASGAIFGLLGSLLYFGYHYRLILGNSLRHEVIPVILANLLIGLMIPGVDIWAHIGGLVGGVFATMAVGVPGKINQRSIINGVICTLLLIGFLGYIVFYYI